MERYGKPTIEPEETVTQTFLFKRVSLEIFFHYYSISFEVNF